MKRITPRFYCSSVLALVALSLSCGNAVGQTAAKKKAVKEKITADVFAEKISSVRVIGPVYPFEQLMAGKEGYALVEFTVDSAGQALMPQVVEASDPEFGYALMADIESNEFMPPRTNGKVKTVGSKERFDFKADAGLDKGTREVVLELRKETPDIIDASALDSPLQGKYQPKPVYPFVAMSDSVSGEATIEFIVDRSGKPRAMKIVKASLRDFGWAAVTAIGRWRYTPPLKEGQRVLARMQITMKFDADTLTATW